MDLLEKNKDFKPIPVFPGQLTKPVTSVLGQIIRESSIEFDSCNITLTTTFGTFTRRNPACQPPAPPPPPLPNRDPVTVPRNLLSCGNSLPVLAIKILASQESTILNSQEAPPHRKGAHYICKQDVQIINIEYPVEFVVPEGKPKAGSVMYGARIMMQIKRSFDADRIDGLSNTITAGFQAKVDYEEIKFYDVWLYSKDRRDINPDGDLIYIEQSGKSYPIYEFAFTPEVNIGDFDFAAAAVFGRAEAIDAWELTVPTISQDETVVNQWLTTITKRTYQIITTCGDIRTPPPPPQKKECKCMCCPENKNDDALLKLILKRIGNLPASVPDNFTKQNPSMINVESLAELAFWQMQQLDALMGAYPIKIEVEDTDLTQEGNQTQKLELPNQAEVLAEILGMMLTIKRDTHATLITAIKAMGEAGMTKNLAVQTLDVTLGNAEFLGYKLEQVKRKVPSLFTPGGANLTETLKEKEVEIVSYENNDKNDLQDDLKFLKTMAARWNAQNWRQVTGDPVESLKQTLFGNPDAIKETHKEGEQGDFNDFTEQAERGFIEVSGITDTVNPWGRPYSQRPKIREIGTEKGNYGKDGNNTPG
ncbi:hypothetical protein [Nostoc sp.]|uniref:hypothetical protein n=1 Tax=Nostoc sp. TaxID=1180 RepID=UPI002D76CC64|nr:hypothetical protein [Nostoc sp.]